MGVNRDSFGYLCVSRGSITLLSILVSSAPVPFTLKGTLYVKWAAETGTLTLGVCVRVWALHIEAVREQRHSSVQQ